MHYLALTILVTCLYLATPSCVGEAEWMLNKGRADLNRLMAKYNSGVEQIRIELLKTLPPDVVANTLWQSDSMDRLGYFGPHFIKIAQRHPRTEVAWEALRFVVYVRGFDKCVKAIARRQMLRDHINDHVFVEDLYFHPNHPGTDPVTFYREVLQRPDLPRQVSGLATFSLALALTKRGKTNEPLLLLEAVLQEYGDLPHPYDPARGTLGDEAVRAKFNLQRLQPGMAAPEIEGKDLNGNSFKLSDYRGKVVLLVFCGDWCAPCRRLYAHERAMLNKYGDGRFAIVGVNSDSIENLRKATEREGFRFRWFADGSPTGEISLKWNIEIWPTIFVLDDAGVIRLKTTGTARVDEAHVMVEKLLSK